MIRLEKHDRALEAIHALLVHARMMAGSHAAYEDLVEVLDIAEYLPTLFFGSVDLTDHFREMLREHAPKYSAFQAALERFDKT
jgi:tRNA-dihydrouridine synthase